MGPRNRAGVPLVRALSKLRILSRAQAVAAVRAGRVRVDGRVLRDPAHLIVPERAAIAVDEVSRQRARWRTVLVHKPRGVITSTRDPEGRPTIFDLLGSAAAGLATVGRLDFASSGLLLLTSDTRLANWLTDPANAIPRLYAVTVAGRVDEGALRRLETGVQVGGDRLRAASARIRKQSHRESHLLVELREGKNREVRRMFAAIGHEVTTLKRVQFGGLTLGDLQPGEWREITRRELRTVFPGVPERPARGG